MRQLRLRKTVTWGMINIFSFLPTVCECRARWHTVCWGSVCLRKYEVRGVAAIPETKQAGAQAELRAV